MGRIYCKEYNFFLPLICMLGEALTMKITVVISNYLQ